MTRPALFFAPDKGDNVQASALDSAPSFFEGQDLGERAALMMKNGKFTGDEYFREKPAEYAECVRLLAGKNSVKSIAERLGCSVNTVRAVRRREGATIDQFRAKTVDALAEFVGDAAERFRDESDKMPLDKLAVPLGIAVEKLELLRGNATSRVELVAVPPADAFARYIENLPAMGLGAQVSGQIAGDSGTLDAPSDTQSPAFSLSECSLATPCATRPTVTDGGEGVEICPPPPIMPIHSDAQNSETKNP